MKVENLKVVGISYTLFLEDGSIADSSSEKEPLYFLYGQGNIIPGLEKALNGLGIGDEKTVEIPAKDAYGDPDPQAVQEVPKTAFPNDLNIEVGMTFALQDEEGYQIPGTVTEVLDKAVKIDMNHPLAGENLKFEVKVIDIREATQDELTHGHVHGPGGHHH